LRLLPDIGFGTERYPADVARRLRAFNFVTWILAVFVAGWAVSQFIDPTPGIWKSAVANAITAPILVALPLLHRFGALAAPIASVVVVCALITFVLWFFGTDGGMQMQYLAVAAVSMLYFDTERITSPVILGVVAAALMIVVQIYVPANTGAAPANTIFLYFIAVAAGTCAIVLAAFYYAVREMRRAEAAAERERRRSESLLANILPATVAERLKSGTASVIADRYDDASILFADMAGFTARASQVSPDRLVEFLNHVFTDFDRLVERHGLEKIKTTGDSYMVVSGVPSPRPDHAQALARLALDMRDAATALRDFDNRRVPIRIGIASGPVVAGVVGTRKFFYDVWGDAVNVASRMETTGEPDKIQVSEEAHERLRNDFMFEERGSIEVKGKGRMRTWFLVGRAVK
jgi:adenylate cyclase